jgi:lysophospholipase L1-like esterase
MGIRDWDIVTSYVDSVTTSLKTVTFPKVQEQVKVKNQGNANLTYTIGSQSGTLTPGQSITVNEDISSFTIQAASGTQAFELRAKEKGTEQTEDNSSDVMSLLADMTTLMDSSLANGTTDCTNAYNSAKSKAGKGIVKFPQNSSGTAVYYFSSQPDFSGITIEADSGVKISLPSTNGVSFKDIRLDTPIKVVSRDRNNTGEIARNTIDEYLFISNVEVTPTNKKNSLINSTTFKTWNTISSVISNTTSITKNIDSEYVFNSENGYNGVFFTVNMGNTQNLEYTACFDTKGDVGTGRNGITIYSSSKITLWSIDSTRNINTGVLTLSTTAWNETQKTLPVGIHSVGRNYNYLLSYVLVSASKLNIFINNVYVDTVDVGESISDIGFSVNDNLARNAEDYGQKAVITHIFSATPVKRAKSKDLKILACGDSITFGEGLSVPWTDLFSKMVKKFGFTNVSITNRGIAGYTLSQELSYINVMSDFNDYDYYLVLLGTNDIQQQTDYSQFKTDLTSLTTKCTQNNKKLILGIPPLAISSAETGYGFDTPNSKSGGKYRSAILSKASLSNVYIADVLTEMGVISPSNVLLRDNLHPTTIGAVCIAKAFAKTFLDIETV